MSYFLYTYIIYIYSAIDVKMGDSVPDEKLSFETLGLSFSSNRFHETYVLLLSDL